MGNEKITCPLCHSSRLTETSTKFFCERCKNEFKKYDDGNIPSVTEGFTALINGYELLEGNKYDRARSEFEGIINKVATLSILTDDDVQAFDCAAKWGLILCCYHIWFDEEGKPVLDSDYLSSNTSLYDELLEIEKTGKKDLDNAKRVTWQATWLQKEAIKSVREEIAKDTAVRAINLEKSCVPFGCDKPKDEYLRTVKKSKKKDYFVFISAVTSCENGETLEYKAARKLKKQLDAKNVKSFWWEEDKNSGKWQISTKIAVGLALSSVFFGFVFDGASKEQGTKNGYKYDVLLSDNNRFSKNLDYEFETFNNLSNEDYQSMFINVNFNRRNNVPTQRVLKLFSYGKPSNYHDYEYLDGKDGVFSVGEIEDLSDNKKIDKIVESALQELYNILSLNRKKTYKHEWKKITKCYRQKNGKNQATQQKNGINKNKNNEEEIRKWFTTIEETATDSGPELKSAKSGEDFFTTDSSTPGDYFFEYAIIDEEGNSANDHFNFFLERKYDDHGIAYFDLCVVVNDWNDAFIKSPWLREKAYNISDENSSSDVSGVAEILAENEFELANYNKFNVSFSRGATDFVESSLDEKMERSFFQYTESKGKAVIKKNIDVGGTGYICFERKESFYAHVPNQDQKPTNKKYYFAINLYKKEIIRYSIKAGKGKIKIHILSPIPSKERTVGVLQYDEVPCLRSRGFNRVGEFTLSGRKKSYTIKTACDDIDRKFFRLCLNDESDKQIFYLQYESTEKAKKTESRIYDDGVLIQKTPYFAQTIALKHLDIRKGYVEYDDEEEAQKEKEGDLEWLFPKEYLRERGVIVSMFGPPTAGKSVFISRLFGIEVPMDAIKIAIGGKAPKSVSFTASYILNALKPFVETTQFYNPNVYKKDAQGKYKKDKSGKLVSQKYEYSGESSLVDCADYAFIPYKRDVKGTDDTRDKAKALAHRPVILQLSKKRKAEESKHVKHAWMSFFDIPGNQIENILTSSEFNQHPLNLSDCIILLIHDDIEKEGNTKESDISKATRWLKTLQEKHSMIDVEKNDKKAKPIPIFIEGTARRKQMEVAHDQNVALAVVLCKFDEFEKKFISESALRSTPPIRAIDEFGGSALQRYIDDCSEEIKSYLKMIDMSGELVTTAEKYPHHKFFAVSSIGRTDSIQNEGPEDQSITRYITPPRGIENVILWLAWQTGIID